MIGAARRPHLVPALETDVQADSAGDPPVLADAFTTLRFVTALPVRLA